MSAVHKILRTRLYTGTFEWRGELYKGSHQPLTSHELWHAVQDVVDGRRTKRQGLEQIFAVSGLIKCAHCGCALVVRDQEGEVRLSTTIVPVQGKMWRALCPGGGSRGAVRSAPQWPSDRRLQKRIDAMYVDRLDGRIDEGFYKRTRAQWRDEQERRERDIERHRTADDSYMDQGIQILDLARNAHRLFAAQPAKETRSLLNFLLSNCTWQRGTLAVEYKEPFDMLAETVAAAERVEATKGPEMAQKEVWLGRQDSNLGMAESKSAALPLGYAPSHCTCRT